MGHERARSQPGGKHTDTEGRCGDDRGLERERGGVAGAAEAHPPRECRGDQLLTLARLQIEQHCRECQYGGRDPDPVEEAVGARRRVDGRNREQIVNGGDKDRIERGDRERPLDRDRIAFRPDRARRIGEGIGETGAPGGPVQRRSGDDHRLHPGRRAGKRSYPADNRGRETLALNPDRGEVRQVADSDDRQCLGRRRTGKRGQLCSSVVVGKRAGDCARVARDHRHRGSVLGEAHVIGVDRDDRRRERKRPEDPDAGIDDALNVAAVGDERLLGDPGPQRRRECFRIREGAERRRCHHDRRDEQSARGRKTAKSQEHSRRRSASAASNHTSLRSRDETCEPGRRKHRDEEDSQAWMRAAGRVTCQAAACKDIDEQRSRRGKRSNSHGSRPVDPSTAAHAGATRIGDRGARPDCCDRSCSGECRMPQRRRNGSAVDRSRRRELTQRKQRRDHADGCTGKRWQERFDCDSRPEHERGFTSHVEKPRFATPTPDQEDTRTGRRSQSDEDRAACEQRDRRPDGRDVVLRDRQRAAKRRARRATGPTADRTAQRGAAIGEGGLDRQKPTLQLLGLRQGEPRRIDCELVPAFDDRR